MTIRWTEGFEIDRNIFALDRVYKDIITTAIIKPQWLTANSRGGGYYFRPPSGFKLTLEDGGVVNLNPNSRDTVIFGFAFRGNFRGFGPLDYEIWNVRDNASLGSDVEQFSVRAVSADNLVYKWRVEANGVLVGETSSIYKNDEWYYVEFEIKVHNTTGTLKIYIDGVTIVNLSGLDTSSKGSGVWGHFKMNLTGGNQDFDDFYVISVEASGNNNIRLGDILIEAIHPIGDSVAPTPYNDWSLLGTGITSKWEAVDEGKLGWIDDDISLVFTSADNKKQLFQMNGLIYAVPDNVKLFSWDIDARTFSQGSKNLSPSSYSAATGLVNQTNIAINSTAYKRKRHFQETPINTSFALDFAAGVEYGFESKA